MSLPAVSNGYPWCLFQSRMQDTCINDCSRGEHVEVGSGRCGLRWYGASLGLLKTIPLGNGGVELARASMLNGAVHKLGQPVGEVVQPGLALPGEKVGFWAELPTLNQPAVSTGWAYVLPHSSLTGRLAQVGHPSTHQAIFHLGKVPIKPFVPLSTDTMLPHVLQKCRKALHSGCLGVRNRCDMGGRPTDEIVSSLLCPVTLQHILARCDFEGIGPILEGNDLHEMGCMCARTLHSRNGRHEHVRAAQEAEMKAHLCTVAVELSSRLSLHCTGSSMRGKVSYMHGVCSRASTHLRNAQPHSCSSHCIAHH